MFVGVLLTDVTQVAREASVAAARVAGDAVDTRAVDAGVAQQAFIDICK